jgi:branched-chain amino acid transport system ATP-binding protein
MLLEGRDIDVRFGGLQALSGVTFGVAEGEIVGLLGPNGAGKTTLLNVLSGFQRPTAGTLLVDGKPATGASPARLARQGIARTFQAVRLFGGLTARENVVASALSRLGHSAAEKLAEELLHRFGLPALADRKANTLSYAQERLVGIARALALAPRVLLLDEPAAGMTEGEMSDLARLLQTISREFSCTLVLVEHNMSLVSACCNRLHVLAEGRTLTAGVWAEVSEDPVFRQAYLGVDA